MGLDIYDYKPKDMLHYLQYYGWHFTRKMCNFAVLKMRKNGLGISVMTKELVDNLLKLNGIQLKNNELYDATYVANMIQADYMGSSIPDMTYLAKHIKDYMDDEDGYPERAFSHFYIDTVKKGIPIDWESML